MPPIMLMIIGSTAWLNNQWKAIKDDSLHVTPAQILSQ